MSYNPHRYKHLFPKGFFNYPNENLVNWNESHTLFALNAIPLAKSEKKIAPGLVLKTGHLNQPPGFSNYLICEIDPKIRDVQVQYFPKMTYPVAAHKKLQSPFMLMNLGYFYLTDEEKFDPVPPPKVRTTNMVISNGRLINLPILNRSAFISLKDNSLILAFVQAQGKVKVGSRVYSWVGSKTKFPKNGKIVVYNASNIDVVRTIDPVMGPTRTVKENYVRPAKNCKLLVTEVNRGQVRVVSITKLPVVINNLDMVLNVPESLPVSCGDKIIFETVDRFPLSKIQSAVTAGPLLLKDHQKRIKQMELEGFENDSSLSAGTHAESTKYARGCLVGLPGGKFATIAIDGIPQAGEIYPGVTPKELSDFVKKMYPDYEAAMCTDPSSTMKVVYKINGQVHVFGNKHYLAHKKLADGTTKFWPSGDKGRKINSMLIVN